MERHRNHRRLLFFNIHIPVHGKLTEMWVNGRLQALPAPQDGVYAKPRLPHPHSLDITRLYELLPAKAGFVAIGERHDVRLFDKQGLVLHNE